jgi:hypothetical protein
MLEDVAIAISTGAAGNIVAYMLNDQMDALRGHVAKILRHGTGQERSTILQALERDADALGEQDVTPAVLTDEWSNVLLSYLNDHPEAHPDIESFASSQASCRPINIGAQNHFGSGPQIGGDNYGSMSFDGQR